MKILLLLLLLLPLLSAAATPKSPQALLNAVETLSNSGYNAMSLTIQLILSDSSLPLQTTSTTKSPSTSTTLTIFSPPDSSFQLSGQPSLSQLLLHFSPLSLSLSSLSSLPMGTKIPTLSPSLPPLIITSKPHSQHPSINSIPLLGSPLFDDGNVVVFAIQDFFPPNFTVLQTDQSPPTPPQCSDISPFSTLFDASSKLKSRGYSIMASFLELQLIGYLKGSPALELTMFAPQDDVLIGFSGDVPSYAALLMKHMLPCRLSYADLSGVKNGTIFKENFEGLSMMIERTETDFFVNGVQIMFPDMYSSDSLVVHGISGAITRQPDDTVEEEAVEKGDEKEEDEDSVASVSYSHRASGPNGNEL